MKDCRMVGGVAIGMASLPLISCLACSSNCRHSSLVGERMRAAGDGEEEEEVSRWMMGSRKDRAVEKQ